MSTNNYHRFHTRKNSVRLLLNQLSSLHPKNRPERGHTLRASSINNDPEDPIPVFYAIPLLPRSNTGVSASPFPSPAQGTQSPDTMKRRPVPATVGKVEGGKVGERAETVVRRPVGHRYSTNKSNHAPSSTGTLRRRNVHIDRAPSPSPTTIHRTRHVHMSPPLTHINTIERDKAKGERKARRDARRSFRESEDFLGVQGVNPRTGVKDTSAETTGTVDTVGTKITVASVGGTGTVDLDGSLDLGSVGTGVRVHIEERRTQVRDLRGRYIMARENFKEEVRGIKRERRERHVTGKSGAKRRTNNQSSEGTGGRGRMKRKEAKWVLSETGWNSVISPDATSSADEREKEGKQEEGYFDVIRRMSVIPESPGGGKEEVVEVVRTIRDVRGVEDVQIGFEEFRRRCRRHRRSFK